MQTRIDVVLSCSVVVTGLLEVRSGVLCVKSKQEQMENQMPTENRLSLDNDSAPLLGNLKRSSAMAALSPKERQRMDAKSFKMPAPVPPILRERNKKGEDVKRKAVPNPVKVPARSAISYPERCSSISSWNCFCLHPKTSDSLHWRGVDRLALSRHPCGTSVLYNRS